MSGPKDVSVSYSASATATVRESLSGGARAAYLVIGAVVFVLAILLLYSGLSTINGGSGYFAMGFLQWLVIIALFLIGISNVISGVGEAEGASRSHRGVRIAIGVIVIILAIIALLPVAFNTTIAGLTALTFLWIVVGVALTLEGIFLILVGLVPELERWQRALSITLGVIVLAFGIVTWIFPSVATWLIWLIISIALLAFGIRFLV
ncbi:MAG: hypothetical protein ABSA15_07160, partial [Thermoplasmata archaeon]